ncbi:hypothetical protein B566_EDAN012712 [Ephemera danica]|nr:hypothetical protein B566_EDAN012712 [Ephemera danica]
MLLSRCSAYSLRLSTAVNQGVSGALVPASERLVLPSAALLAGLGLALSSFSLKQLLATHRPICVEAARNK